jgi:predicted DNA-binding protein
MGKTKPKSVRLTTEMDKRVKDRLAALGGMEFSDYVKELIRKDILRGGDFTVIDEAKRNTASPKE